MKSNGIPLIRLLEEKARHNSKASGEFEGHNLSVEWDPDTQYNYRWDGEVVTQGKAFERLRHE